MGTTLPYARIVRHSETRPSRETVLACEAETHCSLQEKKGRRAKPKKSVSPEQARKIVDTFLQRVPKQTGEAPGGAKLLEWEVSLGDRKASGTLSRQGNDDKSTREAVLDLELALSRLPEN